MSRVAFVIPNIDADGGTERQVALIARGLAQRGWRVSVVALSGTGGQAADELQRCGIEFASLGMRKGLADPRGWVRFHRWLTRERPDIVHAHLAHAAWLARWSRLGAKVPVVIDSIRSCHTGGPARRFFYRTSRWLPDHVTAVSRDAAQTHLAAGMADVDKLSVLPNAVDLNHWRPDDSARAAARAELGISENFVWFSAGRLEPVKDLPTLLRAMAQLKPPAQLLIAGRGSLETELRQLAARLGLQSRVRFLGFESNILRWMQAADGFVLSSLCEGSPNVILEAAACGIPTVAMRVPGTQEAIVDGETGLLVAPSDADALASGMTAVMQSPLNERHAMGQRARGRVEQLHSLSLVLDQWEQFYAELLNRKST